MVGKSALSVTAPKLALMKSQQMRWMGAWPEALANWHQLTNWLLWHAIAILTDM